MFTWDSCICDSIATSYKVIGRDGKRFGDAVKKKNCLKDQKIGRYVFGNNPYYMQEIEQNMSEHSRILNCKGNTMQNIKIIQQFVKISEMECTYKDNLTNTTDMC